MQVRLLGPVDVLVDGASRAVSGVRRKALLSVLGLSAGEAVSTDRLVDIVWGDRAVTTTANTLQAHVSHLRRVLGARSAIVARPPGYALDAETDVALAEHLIEQSRRTGDAAGRAAYLRRALDLWRGRPLQDIAGLPWLDEEAARLDRMRADAELALVDARLTLGEHAELVPELRRLTERYPFDEHIHGQLILALYRCGRQADALAAYQRLRRALGDDLGIDPSPTLRQLEAAILRQDAALALPEPAGALVVRAAVPAQLPPAIVVFAGRTAALDTLDRWLADAGDEPTAVPVAAVTGTAGVGKTTLAVHWAHRVAPRLPDGQLYVDLRGFDASGTPATPDCAIRTLLDALGVPAERVPSTVEGRVGLYRSLCAGRRVLVVLDNASGAEQVRPLLPGASGCAVLVTSRDQLAGLAAVEGARLVPLDLLSPAEAADLLTARLGADRTAAEPDATGAIVAACAGLTLAVAVVAARAAANPGFALSDLAAELTDGRTRLDRLDGGELAQVRSVFSWSYRRLGPAAAHLFRSLGAHPGPDVPVPVAASLAGLPAADARGLLADVVRAGLLGEPAPGRFAMHDLLRGYAQELADTVDGAAERAARVRRMLDHYLHTAYRAALLVNPHRDPLALDPPEPGARPLELADAAEARAWFADGHAALVAAVGYASRTGYDRHCYQIAWTLVDDFDRRGAWFALAAVTEQALRSARRMGDPAAEAQAHRFLAGIRSRLGDLGSAHEHLSQALAGFDALGDDTMRAHTYLSRCWLYGVADRRREALAAARRALALYRATGHRAGQARALSAIAWYTGLLGDHRQSLGYAQRSLALVSEIGQPSVEAGIWDTIGCAHHHLGAYEAAVPCFERALRLHRPGGERLKEALVLTHLGETYAAAGDPAAARRVWRTALEIYEDFDHEGADDLRNRLRRPPAAAGTCTPGAKRVERRIQPRRSVR